MRLIDGDALWGKVETTGWWDNRDRDTVERFVSSALYSSKRENVDAVSMFQHEDEWSGLHKEE